MKTISEEVFRELYQYDAKITLLSPGRINLIGEHIDYYGGSVLPASIDKYVALSIGHFNSKKFTIYSKEYNEKITCNLENFIPSKTWIDYFTMSLLILKESGYNSDYFDLSLTSSIPTGAGLSSSAAMVTGFIEILSEFNKWDIPKEKIAFLAQSVEHRLGTPCGLMDQYASIFGTNDSFLLFDCSNLHLRNIHVDLENYVLRLYHTQVHHQLNEGGYALRRAQGEQALQELKSFYSKPGSFSDFTLDELDAMPMFDSTQYKRAKHVITEIARVPAFVKAIKEHDFESAGSLMYSSHGSLKNDYEVSCPEADYIVNGAKMEGISGARIMGGGFGGCVLCLLKKELDQPFYEKLSHSYFKKFNINLLRINFNLGQRSIFK